MIRIIRTDRYNELLDAEAAGAIDAAEAEKWQRLQEEEAARADRAMDRTEQALTYLAQARSAARATEQETASLREQLAAARAGLPQREVWVWLRNGLITAAYPNYAAARKACEDHGGIVSLVLDQDDREVRAGAHVLIRMVVEEPWDDPTTVTIVFRRGIPWTAVGSYADYVQIRRRHDPEDLLTYQSCDVESTTQTELVPPF